MRKFLIILLLPSFLTISKVVSTEKRSRLYFERNLLPFTI